MKNKILKRLLGIIVLINIIPIGVGVAYEKKLTGESFVKNYLSVINFEFIIIIAAFLFASILIFLGWCFGTFESDDVDDSLPA